MEKFIEVILLFFIYSIIGWLWETFYCSFRAKKFVYRGFLVGPYCPIYGFGVLSVLYFVEPFQHNLVLLYVFSAVLVSVLEYLTSYLLELVFHTTWWDYKAVPLNINGRVAIPISMFWGLACVIIVKVIQPQVLIFEQFLQARFGVVLPVILLLILVIDLVYTVTNMVAFQKAMVAWSSLVEQSKKELLVQKEKLASELTDRKEQVTQEIFEKKEQLEVSAEDWLAKMKEKQGEWLKLPKISFNQRRILGNFQHLKIQNVPNLDELKKMIKEARKGKEG